jgi:Ca-activated chloride channel family protein
METGILGQTWQLADPLWLWALLLLPVVHWLRGRRPQRALLVPFAARWAGRERIERAVWADALVWLGLVCVIVALARPQIVEQRRQVEKKGYDIVLAIDLSPSMLAEDYEEGGQRLNRLQAIKPIIEAFTDRRTGDRIGVVVFGGRAYTLAPLSFDHPWLRRQIARLKVGLVEDGTAVGDALALAVSRLGQVEREQAGRRLGGFVILLTDGANNSGSVEPLQAARLAEAKGIPVYTIGAGREGLVPMPVTDQNGRVVSYRRVRSSLDEATLRRIADATGARYFRARDADTVEQAFQAIDSEKPIEFDAKAHLLTEERFAWFAAPGLLLFAAGLLGARTPGRTVEGTGEDFFAEVGT